MLTPEQIAGIVAREESAGVQEVLRDTADYVLCLLRDGNEILVNKGTGYGWLSGPDGRMLKEWPGNGSTTPVITGICDFPVHFAR